MSSFIARFMPTIWNSYSKSETARRPRMITLAPTSAAQWISRFSNGCATISTPAAAADRRAFRLDHRHPLLEVEHRPLVAVDGDADDQPVHQAAGAADDVDVAEGDRVEGARIEPDAHRRPPPVRCREATILRAPGQGRSRAALHPCA